MERIWLKNYPEGIPSEIDPDSYSSLPAMFDECVAKFGKYNAYSNMGATLTFSALNTLSAEFAAFLQGAGLKKGDRLAIQLPNILQYPVVLFGALRAGLVVVNTNPLYSVRELEHQYKDSGAKALVVFANEAHKIDNIIAQTDIETIVVTGVGDLLGFPKGNLVNAWLKYVRKLVPRWELKGAYSFHEALNAGKAGTFEPPAIGPADVAFLQYTGGTTGLPKGAVLTHRNVVANVLQISTWMRTLLKQGDEVAIAALPFYHIFALTVNCLSMMYYGAGNILITNPRDISGFIKTLKKERFTTFPGLNTLFNSLMEAEGFDEIDFSQLKVSVAGGMALQESVGRRWREATGAPVVEGYGLTETSPVASCNPLDGRDKPGTIGLPLPSTDMMILDDDDNEVLAVGKSGELCIKGPQVMESYWNLPDETSKVMFGEGWFKSGDIAQVDEDGFFKIVDRKKDMILVSGFNVYPNEIEDVVAAHPGVKEVAAIGIPDEKSGEAVKLFVVKKDPHLDRKAIIDHCQENLARYKVPKDIEFRDELPKTNVGKILRRELQDQ